MPAVDLVKWRFTALNGSNRVAVRVPIYASQDLDLQGTPFHDYPSSSEQLSVKQDSDEGHANPPSQGLGTPQKVHSGRGKIRECNAVPDFWLSG